jgi:uncharacterized membrane protein YhaH (DUF805 family)
MTPIFASIGHGLRNVAQFRGRDGGVRFWIYGFFLLTLVIAAMMAVLLPEFARSMERIQAFAAAHPELSTVTSGPGYYSIQIEGYHPELAPNFQAILYGIAAISLAFVILIAAAVTRRLHDRGKSGWWGFMPLPFLTIGLALMPGLFAGFGNPASAPDMGMFALLFLNNMIYIGTLLALAIMLLLPGTVGENRYGPDWKESGAD